MSENGGVQSIGRTQESWLAFLQSSGLIERSDADRTDDGTGDGTGDEIGNGDIDAGSNEDSALNFETNAANDEQRAPGDRAAPYTRKEDAEIAAYVYRFRVQHRISESELIDHIWSDQHTTAIKSAFWKGLKLPNRSFSSLHRHVKRIYTKCDAHQKWTPESERQLKALVQAYGTSNWKQIGQEMRRTADACRDRWRNYVVCGDVRKSQTWTPDEVQLLRSIIEDQVASNHPLNWGEVSMRMGYKRSRIQCRYKWKKMQAAQNAT